MISGAGQSDGGPGTLFPSAILSVPTNGSQGKNTRRHTYTWLLPKKTLLVHVLVLDYSMCPRIRKSLPTAIRTKGSLFGKREEKSAKKNGSVVNPTLNPTRYTIAYAQSRLSTDFVTIKISGVAQITCFLLAGPYCAAVSVCDTRIICVCLLIFYGRCRI